MKLNLTIPVPRILFCIFSSLLSQTLFCQENASLGTIAVLRVKNVNPSPQNESLIRDFPQQLNSAFAATKLFDVPKQNSILEGLDDEGITPDGLLDLDDYFDVATTLRANFMVIGSVSQTRMTFYCHIRVYSVVEKSLKAVLSENSNFQGLQNAAAVLADRVIQSLRDPAPIDTAYRSFKWSNEFRFAFGPTRIDLQPPAVHFVHQNPPFEISLVAQMGKVGVSYAVTNFDIYADSEPIATINPEIIPPQLLREREVFIGGHTFCFRADVKELRGQVGRSITTAHIVITARYCEED